MKPASRTRRTAVRQRSSATRAARRAVKTVRNGGLHSAKTRLLAAGLDYDTADRYAGAFSQRVTPTAVGTTVVKGRRIADGTKYVKTVAVKLYDSATFAARLVAYRPKDKTAAEKFARIAHQLAA